MGLLNFLKLNKKNQKKDAKPFRTNQLTKKKEKAFFHPITKVKDKRKEHFTEKEKKKGKVSTLLNRVFDFRFGHDKRILIVFILLLLIGIIAVFSSSIIFAYRDTGDKYFYLIRHLRYIGIGFAIMLLFYFVRLELIVKLWFLPLLASIGLLSYIWILSKTGGGISVDGASRWIELGSFQFQPSDFAKLSFVIFVAAFLSNKKTLYRDFSEYLKENLIPFAFWFLLILLLVLIGNTNLGTAMVIGFIGIACYGASIVTKNHLKGFLILISILIIGGAGFGLFESYRMDRIAVWTNYWKTGSSLLKDSDCPNRRGCSDQFDQGLTAIGSGGGTGTGLGQSIGKFNFFKTTAGDDSIIGIIGEELGFYLTSAIILLYLYLIFRCLTIAQDFANKPIYLYILVGSASWIGFQTFVHIGANTGVIPLTGQTLPYVSLGGSSLISLMCAMGLILNASKQIKITDEEKSPDKEKRYRLIERRLEV